MFRVIKFVKYLNDVSNHSDRWLTITKSNLVVPVEPINGDKPISVSKFKDELSALADQAMYEEYIVYDDNENFRLTYKGLHYIEDIFIRFVYKVTISVIIPIVVSFLVNILV